MSDDTHRPAPSRFALLALLLGATGIAFAPLFVRLSELGPSATAFHRLLFALPVMALWMGAERRGARPPRAPTRSEVPMLIAAGLCFAGDLAVWHYSIHFTSVANATLFANVAPIFVTFGAWRWFGERIAGAFLAGLALALVGAALVIGASFEIGGRQVLGDGLGLATAVFYAGYQLSVKSLRAQLSTATIMAWSGVVCTAALLPVALLSGESMVATTLAGWAVLAALAVVSHVGGQGLIAWALAHLPSSFSSVALLWQPVAAALLAWWVLSETLTPWQALGGLVVLVGIQLARRASLPPVETPDTASR